MWSKLDWKIIDLLLIFEALFSKQDSKNNVRIDMKQLLQHKTKQNDGVEGLLKRKNIFLYIFCRKRKCNSRVVARALLSRC